MHRKRIPLILQTGPKSYQLTSEMKYPNLFIHCTFFALASVFLSQLSHGVTITEQPASITIADRTRATLSVTATGSGPLTYSWFKDGVPLRSRRNIHRITGAKDSDEGNYQVLVTESTDPLDFAYSNVAVVTVLVRPSITTQPSSQTVNTGDAVNLTVVAAGDAPFGYQWMLDGQNIPGATSATYAIPSASALDEGKYTVTVSNGSNVTVTSRPATLSVNSAPVIAVHPMSLVLADNGRGTLSVDARGTGRLSYQWFQDGVAIPRANSSKLNIQGGASAAGAYTVAVSNDFTQTLAGGVPALSNPAIVSIHDRPAITMDPTGGTFNAGDNVSLTAVATGTGPLSYQWQRDRKDILGATSATLNFPSIAWADMGSYQVIVSNLVGSATSKAARVDVNSPPFFERQPAPSGFYLGKFYGQEDMGGFAVLIKDGQGTALGFNTSQDEGLIAPAFDIDTGGKFSGETLQGGGFKGTANASLMKGQFSNWRGRPGSFEAMRIDDVGPFSANAGYYVGTYTGASTSGVAAAILAPDGSIFVYNYDSSFADGGGFGTVNGSNVIAAQLLTSGTTIAGNLNTGTNTMSGTFTGSDSGTFTMSRAIVPNGATPSQLLVATNGRVMLSVTTGGGRGTKYQWFKDGVAIDRAAMSRLNLTRLSDADEGVYWVVATNQFGSTTSSAFNLVVEDPPTITTQPTSSVLAAVGSNVTLSVVATGAPTLQYQWQVQNQDIPGATSSSLTLTGVATSDTGTYRCIVTNPVGAATSRTSRLTVLEPPAITTQPSDATVEEFEDLDISLAASGASPLQYQWQRIEEAPGGGDVYTNLSNQRSDTLSFTSIQPEDAGRYRCIVSNKVGSIASNEIIVAVTPKPGPAITGFIPTRGQAGDKILVSGFDFTGISSAKIGAANVGFVVNSDSQVILTVPATGAGSGVIELSNTRGTGTSVSQFTRTTSQANDDIADSTIVSGTTFSVTGDTTGFTIEPALFIEYYGTHSAWYRWEAPQDGTYRLTLISGGFNFDTVLGYIDASTGFYDLVDNAGGGTNESFTLSATAGDVYYFKVAGDDSLGYTPFGPYFLNLTPLSLMSPMEFSFEANQGVSANAPLVGQAAWDGDSASAAMVETAADGDQEISLGGIGGDSTEPVSVWRGLDTPATSGHDVIAAVTLRLESAVAGSNRDQFAWAVYDSAGTPLASLWFGAESGSIHYSGADGGTSLVDQIMVDGSPHRFEIVLSAEDQAWHATMDGVLITPNIGLPDGFVFGDVAAIWQPPADGPGGARMIFDNVTLFERVPPEEAPSLEVR